MLYIYVSLLTHHDICIYTYLYICINNRVKQFDSLKQLIKLMQINYKIKLYIIGLYWLVVKIYTIKHIRKNINDIEIKKIPAQACGSESSYKYNYNMCFWWTFILICRRSNLLITTWYLRKLIWIYWYAKTNDLLYWWFLEKSAWFWVNLFISLFLVSFWCLYFIPKQNYIF